MARRSIIGVSDEEVKNQILSVFSPLLSECEVMVEMFAGNVMIMLSGSKDGIQYVVTFDVRDLVFAWEGDYFGKYMDGKRRELQARIRAKQNALIFRRLNQKISDDAEWMDVTLSLKIAKLRRTLNEQIIHLQYGRGYQEEFIDGLLLEVEDM